MASAELKACPHGKQARVLNIGGEQPFSIAFSPPHRCINIGMGWFASRSDAIAAWNELATRTPPKVSDLPEEAREAVERVQQFMDAFIPGGITPKSWPEDHWIARMDGPETLRVNDLFTLLATARAATLPAQDALAELEALRAENERLAKATISGILGELLDDDETAELVAFVKMLRSQASSPSAQDALVELRGALEATTARCAQYADFIEHHVKADDLELHPYLPQLQGEVADALTGWFTPGPWDADWWEHVLRDLHNFLPDGLRGPRDEDDPWGTREDKFNYPGLSGHDDANARLIAAAPEMFAALVQYADDLRHPPEGDSRDRRLERVRKILAKVQP